MSELRMAVIGATGLIGRTLIERAVGMPGVRLAAIARRRIELPKRARMEMFVAEPRYWDDVIQTIRPDVIVSALGTTRKKAGNDEAAFRAVDLDLPLHLARVAKAAGVRQYISVSSAGADRFNRNFYLRTKGELEDELGKVRLGRLDLLRPGLLRGAREDDPRPAERLAMIASPLIDLALQGKYRKFRSISADQLVDAIFHLAREKANGRFIHEHDAILRAAQRFNRVPA